MPVKEELKLVIGIVMLRLKVRSNSIEREPYFEDQIVSHHTNVLTPSLLLELQLISVSKKQGQQRVDTVYQFVSTILQSVSHLSVYFNRTHRDSCIWSE